MYVEELDSFIKAAMGKGRFPNTLDDDIAVLRALSTAERNSRHA